MLYPCCGARGGAGCAAAGAGCEVCAAAAAGGAGGGTWEAVLEGPAVAANPSALSWVSSTWLGLACGSLWAAATQRRRRTAERQRAAAQPRRPCCCSWRCPPACRHCIAAVTSRSASSGRRGWCKWPTAGEAGSQGLEAGAAHADERKPLFNSRCEIQRPVCEVLPGQRRHADAPPSCLAACWSKGVCRLASEASWNAVPYLLVVEACPPGNNGGMAACTRSMVGAA